LHFQLPSEMVQEPAHLESGMPKFTLRALSLFPQIDKCYYVRMTRTQFVRKHALPTALTAIMLALVLWFWLSICFGVADWFEFLRASLRLPR